MMDNSLLVILGAWLVLAGVVAAFVSGAFSGGLSRIANTLVSAGIGALLTAAIMRML